MSEFFFQPLIPLVAKLENFNHNNFKYNNYYTTHACTKRQFNMLHETIIRRLLLLMTYTSPKITTLLDACAHTHTSIRYIFFYIQNIATILT